MINKLMKHEEKNKPTKNKEEKKYACSLEH